MSMAPVVIIGAGIGGLAAALDLARLGYPVTVVERADAVGGKMRRVAPVGRPIDAGPTVLTMRHVFESLFEDAGLDFARAVDLEPARILARHAWLDGSRLDLHHDPDASEAAIRAFADDRNARGYRDFLAYARTIHDTVDDVFMNAQRPTAWRVFKKLGLGVLPRLLKIDARRTVWQALGDFFPDPRLRQLFGRYATYAGNSPFEAPGTFNLIAYVEQNGVWRVRGGIHRLAEALAKAVEANGGVIRLGEHIERIETEGGRARAVVTDRGARIAASAVVFNGDAQALAAGRLGEAVQGAVKAIPPTGRSLSALTWCIDAPTEGFELLHHNVFFGDAYEAEFEAIFRDRRLPETPTVYVCAQDRDDRGLCDGPERLLVLVNAPAAADTHPLDDEEIERCEARTFEHLARMGLRVSPSPAHTIRTSPAQWETLFPASGGAIYGPAAHAWNATLKREGAETKIPGLYLCGGSVHPGAGVPMVATSGRMAAERVSADLPLPRRWRPGAISGGTSTRSATMAATP